MSSDDYRICKWSLPLPGEFSRILCHRWHSAVGATIYIRGISMSVEKLSWAFAQEIKPATAKLVLIVLANNCPSDAYAFPSKSTMSRQSSLNRKTILSCLLKLQEMGLIENMAWRVGATKQIKVFDLKSPEYGNLPKRPKNGGVKSPVFTTKGYRKRDTYHKENNKFQQEEGKGGKSFRKSPYTPPPPDPDPEKAQAEYDAQFGKAICDK